MAGENKFFFYFNYYRTWLPKFRRKRLVTFEIKCTRVWK